MSTLKLGPWSISIVSNHFKTNRTWNWPSKRLAIQSSTTTSSISIVHDHVIFTVPQPHLTKPKTSSPSIFLLPLHKLTLFAFLSFSKLPHQKTKTQKQNQKKKPNKSRIRLQVNYKRLWEKDCFFGWWVWVSCFLFPVLLSLVVVFVSVFCLLIYFIWSFVGNYIVTVRF